MKVQFKCFLDNHNSDVCHISHEIFSFFELNEDLIYKLHLGKTNSQVKLRPINYKESNNQNIIYVNPSVFKPSFSDDELINLDRINLNIWIKDINIYIGPVLGIFVKPKLLSVPKKKTARFIHLEAGIKKNFLCYLFSVDSVDWSKHRVKGLTYVPKWNKWTKIWLPLPNAVYDRRSGFTKEQRQKAGQIRRMFKKEFNIKYINRVNYFGKWKPYRELKKYDAIANYLPHTIRYKSFNDVLKMIRTYDFFS